MNGNLLLTFEDEDGNEWTAAAFMESLVKSDKKEVLPVQDMPSRNITLKDFRVVIK